MIWFRKMTIEIPTEIAQSSLSLSAKLIAATVLTYPNEPINRIAKELNCSARNVHKALKQAKIACEQSFSNREQSFANREQSFTPTLVSCVKEENEDKPTPPQKVKPLPSEEEFFKFAALLEASDFVAQEFWEKFSANGFTTQSGEPIGNWKAYFQAVVNKQGSQPKPNKNFKPKSKGMSNEDRMFAIDSGY